MPEFRVDISALSQLAYELAVIRDSLTHAKADLRGAADTVGSHAVASALKSWCSGWDDGRDKIEGEVSSLSAAASGVAEDYLHGETVITGIMRR